MLALALTCAAATLAALFMLERGASRLGLVDRPGGHKIHGTPTPVVGGIGMAVGLLLTWLAAPTAGFGPGIAAGAVALVLVGVADDRRGMPARLKLLAQAAIVATAFVYEDRLLQSLGRLPAVELSVGMLTLPFTVFALTGVINAVNMIDGLDGLAGQVVLVAVAWFGFCGWLLGDISHQSVALAVATALGVFLLFNARLPGRSCARIFMGDTGSMLLGYLLGWMALDLTQRPHGLAPVVALWICALPILDTVAVASRRMHAGRPPMAAGRDHLHHLLRDAGLSVPATALAEAGIGALFGLVGVGGWLLGASDWVMLVLFLATSLAYLRGFRAAWIRREEACAAQPAGASASAPPVGGAARAFVVVPAGGGASPAPAARSRAVSDAFGPSA